MAQLRRDVQQFTDAHTTILVVGPDSAEAFKAYWQEHDLPFEGLPDPGHTILKRYGQETRLFKLGRMPAMVIVDRAGLARFAHYGHAMSDIPANDDVLSTIHKINEENHAILAR